VAPPTIAGRAYQEEVRKYLANAFRTGGAQAVQDLLPPKFALAATGGVRVPDVVVLVAAATALLFVLDAY